MSTWEKLPKPYDTWRIPSGSDVQGPGVYTWSDRERSYVGMAANVWSRLGDHRRAGALFHPKSGTVYPVHTVGAAARLERTLIWLLNPSENESRPAPTFAVWVGSLGVARPASGWSWMLACGHVLLAGDTLVTEAEVTEVGCGCRPLPLKKTLKRYIDGLEAEATRLAVELLAEQRANRGPITETERLNTVPGLQGEVGRLMSENERLVAEVERLERIIDRTEWTA